MKGLFAAIWAAIAFTLTYIFYRLSPRPADSSTTAALIDAALVMKRLFLTMGTRCTSWHYLLLNNEGSIARSAENPTIRRQLHYQHMSLSIFMSTIPVNRIRTYPVRSHALASNQLASQVRACAAASRTRFGAVPLTRREPPPTLQRQHRENVILDQRRESLQFRQRHIRKSRFVSTPRRTAYRRLHGHRGTAPLRTR